MLLAIGHQLFEQTIKLSAADDAIELSDLSEDIEEELESKDKVLVVQYANISDIEIGSKIAFPILQNESLVLEYHRKIPVPPPELV